VNYIRGRHAAQILHQYFKNSPRLSEYSRKLLSYLANISLWGYLNSKDLIINAIPYKNIKLDDGPLVYSEEFIQIRGATSGCCMTCLQK
jgi:hypothetical protein